jgi:hypothetical protein
VLGELLHHLVSRLTTFSLPCRAAHGRSSSIATSVVATCMPAA